MSTEAEFEKMEEEIARLKDSLDAVTDERDSVQKELDEARVAFEDRIDELEGTEGDTQHALNEEKSFNETARRAISVLNTYLSWLDNPPSNISEDDLKTYIANARRDLDTALREVV